MRRIAIGVALCSAACASFGANAPVLRYQFTADQELIYQSATELRGSVTFTPDQGKAQQLPLTMKVTDTMSYRVSLVKPDGAAWVAAELTELKIEGRMFDTAMNLEMADIGEMIMISLGPKNWLVERPGEGPTPPPEEIGLGFTTTDAAALFLPVKLLIAPTGEILERDGKSWQDQLAKANPMGAWLPILRPFGDGLPGVPGRAVDPGQTWHQERELRVPMSEQGFPIRLDFQLAEPHADIPGQSVSYTGSLEMADIAMRIEPMPGLQVPLQIAKLEHRLNGMAWYDTAAGKLLRQDLQSKVTSSGRGEMQTGFSLESTLDITSQRLLVDGLGVLPAD